MNLDSPADLSPLSYGCGLTLGLALLIGLPAAPPSTPTNPNLGSRHHPPAQPTLDLPRGHHLKSEI